MIEEMLQSANAYLLRSNMGREQVAIVIFPEI